MIGLNVIESPHLNDGHDLRQVRFPRSKSRRIRKKWAKRPANWARVKVKEPDMYLMHDVLLVARGMRDKIERELSKLVTADEPPGLSGLLTPTIRTSRLSTIYPNLGQAPKRGIIGRYDFPGGEGLPLA